MTTTSAYPRVQVFHPDGVSPTFELNDLPAPNSLLVVWNGLVQHPGVDYTLSESSFTLNSIPAISDNLLAFYKPYTGSRAVYDQQVWET